MAATSCLADCLEGQSLPTGSDSWFNTNTRTLTHTNTHTYAHTLCERAANRDTCTCRQNLHKSWKCMHSARQETSRVVFYSPSPLPSSFPYCLAHQALPLPLKMSTRMIFVLWCRRERDSAQTEPVRSCQASRGRARVEVESSMSAAHFDSNSDSYSDATKFMSAN